LAHSGPANAATLNAGRRNANIAIASMTSKGNSDDRDRPQDRLCHARDRGAVGHLAILRVALTRATLPGDHAPTFHGL
jgi:hypothetical protein